MNLSLRDPSYRHPEYPTDPTHDCAGCGAEITGADALCADDCRPRYDRLGAVEYPELAAADAAWLDRTDDRLAAIRRARRAA